MKRCPVSDLFIEPKGNQTLKENTREKRVTLYPFLTYREEIEPSLGISRFLAINTVFLLF